MEAKPSKHQVLIIGGGTAGITVAAILKRKKAELDIAIIEPSEDHYYEPLWTFVAGGVFKKEDSRREESNLIPDGVTWIKDFATSIDPDVQTVSVAGGETVGYDYLIVCPGIQIDWDKIDGLVDTIGQNGVCCNYDYNLVDYTWECLKTLEGGHALFTQPSTPVKCGGAAQKIMYLTADNLNQRGRLDRSEIHFFTPGGTVFGVDGFRETLLDVIDRYGIEVHFKHELVAIDGERKSSRFKVTSPGGETSYVDEPFDMIHVTPPQSAPHFVAVSPLANKGGWLDVSAETLQHVRYPNVFGVGDVLGTPNAKTGAAVRRQAPIVVHNLLRVMASGELSESKSYNGYSSCPVITGYGKLVLAEFGYDNEPMPSFPIDTTKERFSMYVLKKYGLPWMYWNLMLKGKA